MKGNMELADWLLQIKKVASLTHSQEYKLAKAKSVSTPHKMLKRLAITQIGKTLKGN